MAINNNKSVKWMFHTFIIVCVITVFYLLLLVSVNSVSISNQIVTSIKILIFVLLCFSIAYSYLCKQQHSQRLLKQKKYHQKEKAITQIIWRKRFILQAQKDNLVTLDQSHYCHQWYGIKLKFINAYIYPSIIEGSLTEDDISHLIETVLSASFMSEYRPPIYKVRSINP